MYKKVIVVKNNGYDAVWCSGRKISCVVPIILYIWIGVLLVSSAGW